MEFQAEVVDGKITLPPAVREQFRGRLHVIVFAEGSEKNQDRWPEQNRRRWELIVKKTHERLTAAETEELAGLQQVADAQLAQLGSRTTDNLERWYSELTQEH
jgi:hypothetical protein